ncbi:response regulator [Planctomycetota bacterium]
MTQGLVKQDLAQVLILEDEPSQLQTLTSILEEEGFGVVGCIQCADAIAALKRGTISVAIVDLCLPDLSTLELLRALEPWSERIPIIVNTAYGSYESAKEAVNLGAFAYVEKAGPPERLIRQVYRAVEERLQRYAGELEALVAHRNQELEQANATLRASEERFEMLFDQAPLGYQSLDAQGRIIVVNRA